MSSQRSHPRGSNMEKMSHWKGDPSSADDAYRQNPRQGLNYNESEVDVRPYSTIRFSKHLEVYSTQPSSTNCNSGTRTPTKSILRKKTERNKVSGKPPVRRKDSLLDKMKRIPRDPIDIGPLETTEPLEPDPRRQDWNIESLFTPSEGKKQASQPSMKRSLREAPSGIPTRVSEYEQYYSSEYLLNKYAAADPKGSSSQPNKEDEFERKLNVTVAPCLNSEWETISVLSTPKGSDKRRRESFSDFQSNDKSGSTSRRLATRMGRKKKSSYIHLEEYSPNEGKIALDDLEFVVNGGYDLGNLVQQYHIDSSKFSTASNDVLLIQKSTSDMEERNVASPSRQKRFDWDGLYEDELHHFDDNDFRIADSKQPGRTFKARGVWFLVGVYFACFASALIVYLILMGKIGGSPSISSNTIDMVECTNRDNATERIVSDRYNAIRRYLLFRSTGNATMMDQPGSPQREALCWISEFDDYNIDVIDGNEEAILQRYSLAVLYFSTFNDNSDSIKNTDFLSAQHECDWDEIICNHSRAVTILRLPNKSLSGTIPLEIGNLISLNFVDLSMNQLTGIIPTSIAQLSSLEYLSFAFNELKTTIPTFLGRMASLKTLNFRSSEILRYIPTDLGYLSNLELLLLDDNLLSGTIPRELGNLVRAELLNFRKNDLSGTVPTELCELRRSRNLKDLEVDKHIDCDCCTIHN